MMIDKQEKSIKLYSIFGDPLSQFEKLVNLTGFKWRPRPQGILKNKDLQKLKQDYKIKYSKSFKEEEKSDKNKTSSMIK